MKQYLPVNTTIIGSIFLSLLMGGCAIQPAKSRAPAQLEREIKTIEGVKSTTAYQPPVSGEKTTYTVKKGIPCGTYRKTMECLSKQFESQSYNKYKRPESGAKTYHPCFWKILYLPATHSSYTPASNITGGISSKRFYLACKGTGRIAIR